MNKKLDLSGKIFLKYEKLFNEIGYSFSQEWYLSQKYNTFLLVISNNENEYFKIMNYQPSKSSAKSWRLLVKSSRNSIEAIDLQKKFIAELKMGPLSKKEYKTFKDMLEEFRILEEQFKDFDSNQKLFENIDNIFEKFKRDRK
jgi:hypothetical protein